VNSKVLGDDRIDEWGPNAGLHQRATASEICDYFVQALESLLAVGRTRFFPMSDYVGDWSSNHSFVSRLTGATTTVRVRKRYVDATYLETSIPKTHRRSFSVAEGVTCIPINDLVGLNEPASGFTVIGSGKTAMDACSWLLDNGVSPSRIRWIRPRDAWLLDRAYQQPQELVARMMYGISLNTEAVAKAEDQADLFRRLEESGQLLRIDPKVEPTMYRCATVDTYELEGLRSIENVVRLGRVKRIESNRIILDEGMVGTEPSHVYVDCTAEGIPSPPDRPVFESCRITLQPIRTCSPTFNAALTGLIESLTVNDEEKNRLCPPNRYPNTAAQWLRCFAVNGRAQARWSKVPEVSEWIKESRLNIARGVGDHLDEALMKDALELYFENVEAAATNGLKLLAEKP
jgi:hypothetical protein